MHYLKARCCVLAWVCMDFSHENVLIVEKLENVALISCIKEFYESADVDVKSSS